MEIDYPASFRDTGRPSLFPPLTSHNRDPLSGYTASSGLLKLFHFSPATDNVSCYSNLLYRKLFEVLIRWILCGF